MKNNITICILLSSILLILLFTGCNPASTIPTTTTITLDDINYMLALEGLSVHTTYNHSEFAPPPPWMKYPQPLYEPMVIGTVPPEITGSLILEPYGQSGDDASIETGRSVRRGEAFDILVEADNYIYWRLNRADGIGFSTNIIPLWGPEHIGLTYQFGFFYENEQTKIISGDAERLRYSTALRVIADRDCTLRIDFNNYTTKLVDISYSIWDVYSEYDYEDYCKEYDRLSTTLPSYTEEEYRQYYQELRIKWQEYFWDLY